MESVLDILSRGGVLMIPIAIGSVVALAIFIERLWSLRRSKILPIGFVDTIIKYLKNGEHRKARDLCLSSNCSIGRILVVGVDAETRDRESMKTLLEERGKQEIAIMERFIEALGTIASIEPLLGLLGTVTGMIQVFQNVVETSRSGAVDPGQLANGIWQALITTAAGMSVAIVAFIGYRYLQSRTNRFALEMEDSSLALVELLVPSSKLDKNSSKKLAKAEESL